MRGAREHAERDTECGRGRNERCPARTPLDMPGPERARLGAVAAEAHRAPLPRPVARVVDERPAARVGTAGLELRPGAVAIVSATAASTSASAGDARLARHEAHRAVVEPYGETGTACRVVQRRRRGVTIDLDPLFPRSSSRRASRTARASAASLSVARTSAGARACASSQRTSPAGSPRSSRCSSSSAVLTNDSISSRNA